MNTTTFFKPNLMNTKTNFRMLFTALALVFTTIAFAQKTENFITSPQYINGYSVILVFDATFEGFAEQYPTLCAKRSR